MKLKIKLVSYLGHWKGKMLTKKKDYRYFENNQVYLFIP